MNQLLIDGLFQHILSFNDYLDYSKLILVNKLFRKFINNGQEYPFFVKWMGKYRNTYDRNNLLLFACKEGYLPIVKWLYLVFDYNSIIEKQKEKNLSTVKKWLYSISEKQSTSYVKNINIRCSIHITNEYIRKPDKLFLEACNKGHLDVAMWLYLKHTEKININTKYDALDSCCRQRHFTVIEWLNTIIERENINPFRINRSFSICIRSNDIEIIKWFYSIYKDIIYLDKKNNYCSMTGSKDLNIIKWLYSTFKFDIHMEQEIFLRISCDQGNLDVVKWLYSIDGKKIDVDVLNHIFLKSYKSGHNNIVKFLYSTGKISINVVRQAVKFNDLDGWLFSLIIDNDRKMLNNNQKN